jgi:hypothetical protein
LSIKLWGTVRGNSVLKYCLLWKRRCKHAIPSRGPIVIDVAGGRVFVLELARTVALHLKRL